MIDVGVRSGEIDAGQRAMVNAVIRTITTGLTDAVSDNRRRHRVAVDGLLQLLKGRLVTVQGPDTAPSGSPS